MPPNFITKIDIYYLLFDILNIIICKDIVMKSKKISYQPQSDQDIFDNLSGEWWDENGGFAVLHFQSIENRYILNVLENQLKI